ncbi:MAG: hypothetical protein QME05_05910 [Candidatus Margulisbacteria bacterium]|nr:hypothetical protein [Candidatus Margulisiibacteriota bacterium]
MANQLKSNIFSVFHHAEQDHSGAIPRVLEVYKTAKVITNPPCKELLEPVMAKGYPRGDDFKALDRLADDILRKHQESDLVRSDAVICQ